MRSPTRGETLVIAEEKYEVRIVNVLIKVVSYSQNMQLRLPVETRETWHWRRATHVFLPGGVVPADASTLKYANYYGSSAADYTNKAEENGWMFVHNLLTMTGDFTLQPFKSANGKVVTLFNGEICNYQELGLGTFPSDGYALLPAYEKHGEDFASHLHGEYAIVLDFEKMKTS